jgi:hypothetical protein
MTTVYSSVVYVSSDDPGIGYAGNGVLDVSLGGNIPSPRHSTLYMSVQSLNIPIPNAGGGFIPHRLRVHTACPTTGRVADNVSNCLLMINPIDYLVETPGLFSSISYRTSAPSGICVQLLSSTISAFRLALTDGSDKPFTPSFPFDICIRIEIVRNYPAESLAQLNVLVEGQRLLLYQNHLTNKLEDSTRTLQTPGDIFAPEDNEVVNGGDE